MKHSMTMMKIFKNKSKLGYKQIFNYSNTIFDILEYSFQGNQYAECVKISLSLHQ